MGSSLRERFREGREDCWGCLVREDCWGCMVREDCWSCVVREDCWSCLVREDASERGSSEEEEIDLGGDDTLVPPYCFNTESGSVTDDALFAMGLKMRLRSFGGKTLPTA